MRSAPISKLFLVLLGSTFLLVVLLSVRFTYKFAQFSTEASSHARNLQETSELNLRLRDQLNEQVNLVYQQLEHVDPSFPSRFSAINFELGEEQTNYLKLNIGPQERLTVERIKSFQSELALQGLQIHHQLQANNRTEAVLRLRDMKTLEDKISKEFAGLNSFQTNKLRNVQNQLNETVRFANGAIYGLATYLLVALLTFTVLLRRRVLQPLRSLLEAANQVRHGDFSARAPEKRHDELGELAQGFNFMAASLAESYASLEHKVEERTKQLQDLQQQLIQSAKMSAVGRMLSGMAHELNNPLAVIMGNTELAKKRLVAAGGDPREIKLMETLHEQGDRCRKIVANLLQFARQEAPRLQAVKLNDLVEQALQLREYELNTRNIELIREFDPANSAFSADPNKIVQVVLNLLNNAHDAIREAGTAGKIWVRTSTEDGQVRLEFSDNGTGLCEPERVFDPFYTTKEVGQGTGLGLSVCYGIVEEHSGSITAENWEHGARFTILLPTGQATALKQAAEQKEEMKQPPKKYRALVVDDEVPLVDMQTSFLAEIGVEAAGAYSGAEAILYLQSHQVDLVISDVRMPGAVDGIKLYEWVGRNRPNLLKQFLFVSGDMIGMNSGEFFLKSTASRIQKPFIWDDYSSLVQQMLCQGAEVL
jgi:signal transduction histidine kinase/CheY-like chemotaxis protein